MGDDWEEDRLARRDEYAESHRLKLNQFDSDEWNFLNEAQEALMNELVSYSAKFRNGMSQIAALTWVSPEQTLRQAYVTLSDQSLLPSFTSDDASMVSDFISKKSFESEIFGIAVASISGINRCIRGYNDVRLKLYKVTMAHYRGVFPDTSMAGKMRWGETSSLETTDGKVHLLNKLSEPNPLEEISLDSSISNLLTWRAVK
jgi:hypothetical protein